jgi:hypothetical protein
MSVFLNAAKNGIVLLILALVSACGRRNMETTASPVTDMLNDQQVASLASKKIFFGHQSVGNNVIKGIRDLAILDPRLKLNIVKSPDPQSIASPALVEFDIGQNGNPQSKIDAFASVLNKGMGAQGGIAMFKFCYVDIESSTDIAGMFAGYRDAISALKTKYPSLKIVHVTVPLTAVEPAAKAWIKRLLGKATRQEVNVKRNEFNDLMRQTYAGIDPIFDLAEVESTYGNGSRSYFMQGNARIYTLAPEFTADGGHLNGVGRRMAAERLLLVLAQLDVTSPTAGPSHASQYISH